MSLLEAVADVIEMRKGDPTASAQRASQTVNKTDEIASLDGVSRHLLPRETSRPCSETVDRNVNKLTSRRRVLALRVSSLRCGFGPLSAAQRI